jgi:signal recognition particle receptor subunit beta
MAELSHKDRTISTKIVYYGPGMSGKTTNVQVLHDHASAARRGELISVNTAQDRTIMFDLLPIKVAAFRGLDLRVQLVAVPGQPMYAAIRRLALRDVDSVVFVANSAADRQEENVTSFQEMLVNLASGPVDAGSRPLVLQYNKRDLVDAVPTAQMDRALNIRRVTAVPAVAIRGEGVLETFAAILTATVADLTRRYRLSDMGRGQSVEEWTAAAVQEIFGANAFTAATPSVAGGPGRRTVRLTLPPDVSNATHADARTNEALAESYAEAAATISEGAQQIREERDAAQKRLGDVLQMLDAARMLTPGAPRDPLLMVALTSLAQEVDAAHASVLVPAPNRRLRAAALHGLEEDPILCYEEAMPRLQGLLLTSTPRWHETDNDPALHDMLSANRPPLASLVSVPLTATREPIGVALLYRTPAAAPPRRESLKNLAALARILVPFLEPSDTPGRDADAAARELLGTAFRLAAPRLLQGMRDLRQRLTDLRRRPDSPVWLPAALAEIAPTLTDVAAIGRALSGLDTGALEDEPVEVAALLGKFRGVQLQTGPGVTTARVDPVLFGLALEVLIDRARRQAGSDRAVEVRCTARSGRLAFRIGVSGPLALAASRGVDHDLVFPAKVVELHGGQLGVDVDPTQGSWVALDVAAG